MSRVQFQQTVSNCIQSMLSNFQSASADGVQSRKAMHLLVRREVAEGIDDKYLAKVATKAIDVLAIIEGSSIIPYSTLEKKEMT